MRSRANKPGVQVQGEMTMGCSGLPCHHSNTRTTDPSRWAQKDLPSWARGRRGRVGKSKGTVRARPALCSEVLTRLRGRRLSLSLEPGSTALPPQPPASHCLPAPPWMRVFSFQFISSYSSYLTFLQARNIAYKLLCST